MTTTTLGKIMADTLNDLKNKNVYIEGDKIVVKVKDEYPIPLSECTDSGQILSWINQLCGKTWVTNDIIKQFIQVACNHNRIQLSL